MDIFQITFTMFQIAVGICFLAVPCWILSRVVRFMTKSTRKTYSTFR